MNPFPNPNPNQLDPFLLHPSIPYLENPNPTFTSLPFVDYVASPLPPLLPTYNNNFTYGDTINNLAFPYPVPGNPLSLVKGEDGIGIGIGLNLGQRTYFNNTRSLFGFGGYGSGQNPQRCQVDGCKTDLTGAKHYHRRHKVCEFHSKAPMVLIGGLQERFCQQCSRGSTCNDRFHVVAEFDEAKRSCRKRLADHNRRRRKPQPQLPNSKDPTPHHASHNKINSSTTSTTSASNKPTNDTSSITNNSTTSMSSTSCNLEGSHAKIQSEVQALEKLDGTTTTILSLGEVAKFNSEYPNHNLDIFHEQNQGALSFASTLIEEKQALFHHHTIFGSSSSSNKGHALFEVDFMQ